MAKKWCDADGWRAKSGERRAEVRLISNCGEGIGLGVRILELVMASFLGWPGWGVRVRWYTMGFEHHISIYSFYYSMRMILIIVRVMSNLSWLLIFWWAVVSWPRLSWGLQSHFIISIFSIYSNYFHYMVYAVYKQKASLLELNYIMCGLDGRHTDSSFGHSYPTYEQDWWNGIEFSKPKPSMKLPVGSIISSSDTKTSSIAWLEYHELPSSSHVSGVASTSVARSGIFNNTWDRARLRIQEQGWWH